MVFQFTNKGGEGGFKFFCESEEDDQHQQGEVLKVFNSPCDLSKHNGASSLGISRCILLNFILERTRIWSFS